MTRNQFIDAVSAMPQSFLDEADGYHVRTEKRQRTLFSTVRSAVTAAAAVLTIAAVTFLVFRSPYLLPKKPASEGLETGATGPDESVRTTAPIVTSGRRYAGNPVRQWPSEDGDYYRPVTVSAFPGVTFTHDPESGLMLANGEKVLNEIVSSFVTSDLTGDGYPELFLTVPEYGGAPLVKGLYERIREDFAGFCESNGIPGGQEEPSSLNHFGSFNGAVPFYVRNERTDAAPADEVIAGTTFRCGGHDADTIWVWKDGTISKLKEAYDNGYLTAEQIAKVAEIWDTPSKRENLTLVIYDFHAGRELGRLSGNRIGVSPDGYLSIMFDVPGTDAELMQTFFPAYENGAFVIGRYSGRNEGLITYANDPVVHWTEQDGAYAPVTLPAFPGVTVTRDPESGAPETEKRRLTEGPVAAFCSADLNGDGYPELFFLRRKKTADDTETPRTRCEFVIFDYHAGKTVLLVTIPEYDSLSFAVMDGALCLKDRTFDGQSIRYGFPIRYGDGTFSIDWIEWAAGAAEKSNPQRPTASRDGL